MTRYYCDGGIEMSNAHKFIIHVLDKNSDTPILNDFEGRVSQDMDLFFRRRLRQYQELKTLEQQYLMTIVTI